MADPEVVEEWKWRAPVWSHDGLICTGETEQVLGPRAKMKHAPFVAGLVIVALSGCASMGGGELKRPSTLALHMQARGGSAAVRAIKGIELSLDLVEPQFALQAKYVANRSPCMRIDIFDKGKYLQSEGVSSHGGWAVTAGDKSFSPQPKGGTETLLHGIDNPVRMMGLDEFPEHGHKISEDGREMIGSTAYDKINVVYSDGYSAELYLDRTTHLIARMREHKPMHLAVDPTRQTIETQFSDYRSVSGVMFPFFSREVNWETGKELGHTTVESVVLNSEKAAAACRLPELIGP